MLSIVELDKGMIDVQPYEYYDCDCRIRGGVDIIMDLIAGKLDATVAYLQGKFRVEGDFDKAISIAKAVSNTVASKAAPKKKVTRKPSTKTKTAKKNKVGHKTRIQRLGVGVPHLFLDSLKKLWIRRKNFGLGA